MAAHFCLVRGRPASVREAPKSGLGGSALAPQTLRLSTRPVPLPPSPFHRELNPGSRGQTNSNHYTRDPTPDHDINFHLTGWAGAGRVRDDEGTREVA